MVYRHLHNSVECLVCSRGCAVACRNCGGPHCAQHLVGPSCHECCSRLWRRERGVLSAAGIAFGLMAIPIGSLALLAGFDGVMAPGAFMVLIALLIGAFAVPKLVVHALRPLLERKRFAVTSKPVPRTEMAPAPGGGRRTRVRRRASRLGRIPMVVGRGIVFR